MRHKYFNPFKVFNFDPEDQMLEELRSKKNTSTDGGGSGNGGDKGGRGSDPGGTGGNTNQPPVQTANPANEPPVDHGKVASQYLKDTYDIDINELPDLRKKLQEKDELLNASPYKSGMTKELDDLIAKGVPPQTAWQYVTSDPAQMDDISLLVMKKQIEKPTLTAEACRRLVENEYKVGEYENKEATEAQKLVTADLLKEAADDVRANFNEVKERMLKVPGTTRDGLQASMAEKQRVEGIKAELPKIATTVTALDLPISDTKSIPYSIDPVKHKDAIAKATKAVENLIGVFPGLQNDEKGKEYLRNAFTSALKEQLQPQLYSALVRFGTSAEGKKWYDELHNTDLKRAGMGTDTVTNTGIKDMQSRIFAMED